MPRRKDKGNSVTEIKLEPSADHDFQLETEHSQYQTSMPVKQENADSTTSNVNVPFPAVVSHQFNSENDQSQHYPNTHSDIKTSIDSDEFPQTLSGTAAAAISAEIEFKFDTEQKSDLLARKQSTIASILSLVHHDPSSSSKSDSIMKPKSRTRPTRYRDLVPDCSPLSHQSPSSSRHDVKPEEWTSIIAHKEHSRKIVADQGPLPPAPVAPKSRDRSTAQNRPEPKAVNKVWSKEAHSCIFCGTHFTNLRPLTSHMLESHSNFVMDRARIMNLSEQAAATPPGAKLELCTICHVSLPKGIKFTEHVLAIHFGMTPFRCAPCELSFDRYARLSKHLRCVHKVKKKDRQKKWYC